MARSGQVLPKNLTLREGLWLQWLVLVYFVQELLFLSFPSAVIATIWRVTRWKAWGSSPHTTMGGTGFVSGEENSRVLLGTRTLNKSL